METDLKQPPTVVRAKSALVVGNREAFKTQILQLLENGTRDFVIDLTDCEYIDASGFGVLVSVQKKIRDFSGRIVLAGVNPDLREVMQVARLDTIFSIADTLDVAIASLGGAR
jgi:anti-sigma B factor antagonist